MEPSDNNTVNASHPASEPLENKKGSFWHSAWEWAKVIIIALIIALPIRYFVAEPFIVKGASMDPTFSTGQFLIVDRVTYRFESPKRNDVIVFKYPNDPSMYYIKRIIGLPGETLGMKDGHVFVSASSTATSIDSTFTELTEPYIESSHISHNTIPVFTLGPTQYFVMGDNRAESSDSRVWGPLDKSFIIGQPILRLLPPLSVWPGEYKESI